MDFYIWKKSRSLKNITFVIFGPVIFTILTVTSVKHKVFDRIKETVNRNILLLYTSLINALILGLIKFMFNWGQQVSKMSYQ